MQLEIDPDVMAVITFMQANMPVSKLAPVSSAIGRLGPILWDRFDEEEVISLCLVGDPIT